MPDSGVMGLGVVVMYPAHQERAFVDLAWQAKTTPESGMSHNFLRGRSTGHVCLLQKLAMSGRHGL